MTSEEKIDKIYDIVVRVEPMVTDHHKTLYGNGQPGLSKDVLTLQNNEKNCPARKAASNDSKRLTLATAMMIIAIIGIFSSTVFAVLNYLK